MRFGLFAVAFGIALLPWGDTGRRDDCPPLSTTTQAIGRLMGRPWSQWSEAEVQRIWPLPGDSHACASLPCSFPSEWETALRAWCSRCEYSAGITFWTVEEVYDGGIDSIGIMLCPSSSTEVGTAVDEVVDAMAPPAQSVVFGPSEYSLESLTLTRTAYQWTANAGLMYLEVDRHCDRHCYAAIGLRKCRKPEAVAELSFGHGEPIEILDDVGGETALGSGDYMSVRFWTRCHLQDRSCIQPAVEELWPHLRPIAEAQGKTRVSLVAESCGGSRSFPVYRRSSGEWSK